MQTESEQLARSASYLYYQSPEDTAAAQYRMDMDTAMYGSYDMEYDNNENITVNATFDRTTYQGGRGNGTPSNRGFNNYQSSGQYRPMHQPNNGGRTNNGTGRYPPQYTRGQPYDTHTTCMCCGQDHNFLSCKLRFHTKDQLPDAPNIAAKYKMDPNLVALLPTEEAMHAIQTSTHCGNMRFQSAEYMQHFTNFIKLQKEKQKRALLATAAQNEVPGPSNAQSTAPPNLTVASCRVAISESVHQTPSLTYGIYEGRYGIRPQHAFTNKVLAYAEARARQATPREIDTRIARNTLAHQMPATPQTLTELNMSSKDIPEDLLNSTAICLVDGGACPSCIREDMVLTLGLEVEKAHVRLGVAGVFGDVKYADLVSWITLTFKCGAQITLMAIVVEKLNSPLLIGLTDFKNNFISHIAAQNLLTFGHNLNPTHTENLMTEQEIRCFPESGYIIDSI